ARITFYRLSIMEDRACLDGLPDEVLGIIVSNLSLIDRMNMRVCRKLYEAEGKARKAINIEKWDWLYVQVDSQLPEIRVQLRDKTFNGKRIVWKMLSPSDTNKLLKRLSLTVRLERITLRLNFLDAMQVGYLATLPFLDPCKEVDIANLHSFGITTIGHTNLVEMISQINAAQLTLSNIRFDRADYSNFFKEVARSKLRSVCLRLPPNETVIFAEEVMGVDRRFFTKSRKKTIRTSRMDGTVFHSKKSPYHLILEDGSWQTVVYREKFGKMYISMSTYRWQRERDLVRIPPTQS
ncbi:hypothetical protein PFISCL1PPCAC_5151, partial [Pristionchus fissidentatus]